MRKINLSRLYRQLLYFGLNPNEWVIQPLKITTFEITHIDDPEFRFIGKVEDMRWKYLRIMSL